MAKESRLFSESQLAVWKQSIRYDSSDVQFVRSRGQSGNRIKIVGFGALRNLFKWNRCSVIGRFKAGMVDDVDSHSISEMQMKGLLDKNK